MLRLLPALLLALVSCAQPAAKEERRAPVPTRSLERERLRALRGLEGMTRARYDPATAKPWVDVSGADPYRLVATSDGFLGILRGSRALVRLDAQLREQARLPLEEPPTALCVAEDGSAWVASRYGRKLLHVTADFRLLATRELELGGVADVACGQHLYVLPADGSSLLTLGETGQELARAPALPGGLRLLIRGRYLLESSLFARTLRIWELSPRGLPGREAGRVVHDGTLWAFDALEREGELVMAVAGVEDQPLVRVHGEFENIDSFVWVYSLRDGQLRELLSLNVSQHGLVVPKAVHLRAAGADLTLNAVAAGSGRWLRAELATGHIETGPALPGLSDAVFGASGELSYASPLLDAWVRVDRAGTRAVRVEPDRRPSLEVRLGEALFFTELIAPDNDSAGSHSRFTCETCHFEGSVDGRRHYTGRGEVSVVTKPLFGLANNRPHFSRAMDPDLASVSHNEVRVAGAGSGQEPWFTVETARFPWLHELGVERARLEPLALRQALLQFFYAFAPPPNPLTAGRSHFTELEARGAAAFARHCQSCHAPRLSSDEPATAVPFESWERFVFSSSAPIVWARGDYEQSGVLPYVHERGTRITSLRRLALKPRYFTNGSSPTLEDVLVRFRNGAHDAGKESARLAPLSQETRRALLAFLKVL
ncbi:MAG: hypothetical protein EOO73_13965 [Myxococcales bacterium]|nr:MAG: hypothetical protein EOO73_13965 [Myxococcales bacterium]